MIDPQFCYEEILKGFPAEEILRRIQALHAEINTFKGAIEACGDKKPETRARSLERLRQWRECLVLAKKAYKEAGGKYVPTEEERKDQRFNRALPSLRRLTLELRGFPMDFTTYRCTVSEGTVICEIEHFPFRKEELYPERKEMDREAFLNEMAELHMGEWERCYVDPGTLDGEQWELTVEYDGKRRAAHFEGSNAYPYNFNELIKLMRGETAI